MSIDIPKDWGKDELTTYINDARHNLFATYANLGIFRRFQHIDKVYRTIIENISNTKDWFPVFFLLRTHASYLTAVQLSASGQIPEAYMVLRGCLENAFYGFNIYKNPSLTETWLKRNDDENWKRLVKNKFQIKAILDSLKGMNKNLGTSAKELYERTIEYGAHPNPHGILTLVRQEQQDRFIRFDLAYLQGNTKPHALCLKTTAQVGLCCLMIFKVVYKERFDLLGLSDGIEKLSKGL
jgi:hypothetical protein